MSIFDVEAARNAVPAITAWLEFQRRYLRVPGVQVAIRVGDQLVLDTALGFSDEVGRVPLRTDHLFRVASHSKTFTATAIMQLVEAGRLRLDDHIDHWVPALVGTGVGDVTLRELLGHQGGVIRDTVDQDFWQLIDRFPTTEQLLALCRDHGAVFAPNEHFKYSNVGFSLLGLAVEAASGLSYHDYVRQHIVDRLGLTHTGPEWDPDRAADFAAGHSALIDGAEPRLVIGHVDTRAMAAATGFYSTAADLTRYGAAHFFGSDQLITDRSKRLLQREETVVTSHGTEQGRYGLGFEITDVDERTLVGHSGGYPGHITKTFIDRAEQLVVSVLTNCIGGPAGQFATGVIKLLNLAACDDEVAPVPAGVDPSRFGGHFANLMGVIQVASLGERLVAFPASTVDPLESYDELEVVDHDHLVLRPQAGFGPVGESVAYSRHDDGTTAMIRYCGSSRWPVEEFQRRRAQQIINAVQ